MVPCSARLRAPSAWSSTTPSASPAATPRSTTTRARRCWRRRRRRAGTSSRCRCVATSATATTRFAGASSPTTGTASRESSRSPSGRGARRHRPCWVRAPRSACSTWCLRTLYFLGILVGGGAAAFGLLARSVLGDRLRRPLAQLVFFALLATFVGASAINHGAVPGTRYALVVRIAVIVALAGGVAAALSPLYDRFLYAAGACALALLVAPTLAGHALDRDQTRVVVGSRRSRAPRVGRGLARRARLARGRCAARDGRPRRTIAGGAALLDGGADLGRRARALRSRTRADRAAQRLADVVHVLRPRPDRQVGDLLPAARPGLAEPLAPARRLPSPAPLSDARGDAAARRSSSRSRS